MESGVKFADLLRAKLGGCTGQHTPPSAAGSRPATAPLFVFGGTRPRPRHDAYAAADREAPTARPVTVLTADARRALAALNDLGAGLDERVCPAELRRAFRALARRYHPDRHPGSGRAEQERLSRIFVELTDQSRRLAAALLAPTRH